MVALAMYGLSAKMISVSYKDKIYGSTGNLLSSMASKD